MTDSVQAELCKSYGSKGHCVHRLLDCNTRGIDELRPSADNFCYDLTTVWDDATGHD